MGGDLFYIVPERCKIMRTCLRHLAPPLNIAWYLCHIKLHLNGYDKLMCLLSYQVAVVCFESFWEMEVVLHVKARAISNAPKMLSKHQLLHHHNGSDNYY